jgi:hypothetical protein
MSDYKIEPLGALDDLLRDVTSKLTHEAKYALWAACDAVVTERWQEGDDMRYRFARGAERAAWAALDESSQQATRATVRAAVDAQTEELLPPTQTPH